MKAKISSRKDANNLSPDHAPLPASAFATGGGQDLPPSSDPGAAEIVQIFKTQAADLVMRANLAAEYFAIREKEVPVQGVQNPSPGRPGIMSLVARELALPGKSEGAKRIWLHRALRIASMPSSVQDAAVTAQLGQNQSALLEIAGAGTEKHQLDKIVEITARKSEPKTIRKVVLSFPVQREVEVRGLLVTFAKDNGLEISG